MGIQEYLDCLNPENFRYFDEDRDFILIDYWI